MTAMRGEDGELIGFIGISTDITDRKAVEMMKDELEKALRRSEERLQAILDYTPSIIFVKDLDGRYLVVNNSFERLLGPSQAQAVGNTDFDLFPESIARAFHENDLQVIHSGKALNLEEVAQHQDGPHTSLVVKFPLRDADGQPYAVCGIATDITQRVLAEEALLRSEQRHRLAIQATRDVIYDRDLVTGETVWSPATMDVFGFAPGEMGLTVEDWEKDLHPEDLPRLHREVAAAIERGGTYVMEYRHRRKDGGYADVMDRGQVVNDADGHPLRAVGAMMDVTERRAIEQMKDAFVATVSHELRTPLNGIIGVSQLLLGTVLDATQHEYAQIIHRSGQALHRLIDDVLTLARFQSVRWRSNRSTLMCDWLSRM